MVESHQIAPDKAGKVCGNCAYRPLNPASTSWRVLVVSWWSLGAGGGVRHGRPGAGRLGCGRGRGRVVFLFDMVAVVLYHDLGICAGHFLAHAAYTFRNC